MSGRKKKQRGKAESHPDAAAAAPRSSEAAVGAPESSSASWFTSRALVLRYFAVFGLCVVLFYAVTAMPWFRAEFFPAYLELNATLSATLLSWLGEAATAKQFTVTGARFSLEVQRGCDAIEPSALYAAAVAAMPAPFRHKLLGLGLGVPTLLLTNLIRILSLYYTGAFFPDAFEVVHVDVWQPLFILLALTLWIVWILWSLKARTKEAA